MSELQNYLVGIVANGLKKKGALLGAAAEPAQIERRSNRVGYITEERYEIESTTEVNRVFSTTNPTEYIDVTEKITVIMESSKGGATRDHYLSVNG